MSDFTPTVNEMPARSFSMKSIIYSMKSISSVRSPSIFGMKCLDFSLECRALTDVAEKKDGLAALLVGQSGTDRPASTSNSSL